MNKRFRMSFTQQQWETIAVAVSRYADDLSESYLESNGATLREIRRALSIQNRVVSNNTYRKNQRAASS